MWRGMELVSLFWGRLKTHLFRLAFHRLFFSSENYWRDWTELNWAEINVSWGMCTGPLEASADLVLSSSSMICRVLLLSVSDDVFITDSSSSSSCVLVVNCWRQSCSDSTYRQTDRQTLSHIHYATTLIYMQHFTILEVAAYWHELVVPQW